ncbi:hypothetical protein [Natrinema salsiterrestre]|uniref:Uncharacterized protein n=1 Tax=Natrinema salsiterrestre TaxID=2950540 RepID=A0A9Q4L876_9EURY|nr:hypothetical protein [Natrinema salsiterrestre]MDF9747011.1 hypothetical protein [Natrinema salsiterrestre]
MRKRTLLTAAGTALTGSFISGTVAGATVDSNDASDRRDELSDSDGAALELSGENMLSEDEMITYAEEKAEEYDIPARDIVPTAASSDEIGTQSADIDTTNLGWVGGWNLEYDVTCCPGNDVMGKVENTLSMYRGEYRAESDKRIYFFWMWSNGKPQTIWQLGAIRSKLDVTDGSVEVTDFSPSSRVNKGDTADVGFDISTPGGTVGISGQASTSETYQHNKSVNVDDAGHVTVELKDATGFWSSWSSPQQINACVQVRSNRNYEPGSDIPHSDFYWRVWGE